MPYPVLKGKHLEKAVFSVEDFVRYAKRHKRFPKQKLPESAILVYQRSLLHSILSANKVQKINLVYRNFYSISKTKGKVGVIGDFGIGAPVSALLVEEMIGLGIKRFVIIGTAGSISPKVHHADIVVCSKSIRDEGTSHHYFAPGKYAYPSKILTDKIKSGLESKFLYGPSWTIDAPYRETIRELVTYRGEGVLAVEMEASAVFTVATLRKVESAAVFAISDVLSETGWRPGFAAKTLERKLYSIFEQVTKILCN